MSTHQYASKGPPPRYGPPQPPSHSMFEEEHYFAPSSHDSYEPPPSWSKSKELSVKDFFEITLTALAFLAFGLFIIQLLMHIANAKRMTALPMDIDGNRFKRSTSGPSLLSYAGNEDINELSHRVLRSIEAAMVAQQDSGNCLRRVICEDNKYSRENKDARRLWLPLWSVGMSWLSGRVVDKAPWSATLDSVKAAILGLGGADCEFLYPECNLEKERRRRRKRR